MKKTILLFVVLLFILSYGALADGFDDVSRLTGHGNFEQIADALSNGSGFDIGTILTKIYNEVVGDIKKNIASVTFIIVFATISSGINSAAVKVQSGTDEIVFLVVYGVISALMIDILKSSVELASEISAQIAAFVKMSIPSYIAITACVMPEASTVGLGSVFLLMTNIVSSYAGEFMISILFYTGIMCIINNMSLKIHIKKFIGFVKQAIFWILGFMLTVFAALIGFSGINASLVSSWGMSAAKYAIGHTIPIVGNFLADSADVIFASATIVKSSFGMAGIIIIICMCIFPVLKLFVSGMMLKAAAGIMEPYCDRRICDCTSDVGSTIINMMILIILMCVMFMFALAVLILTGRR